MADGEFTAIHLHRSGIASAYCYKIRKLVAVVSEVGLAEHVSTEIMGAYEAPCLRAMVFLWVHN